MDFTSVHEALAEVESQQLIVPIMPFRLQQLGYTSPPEIVRRSSWLFLAYSFGILLGEWTVRRFPVDPSSSRCPLISLTIIVSVPFGYIFAAHHWRRGPLVLANLIVIAALLGGMLVKSYIFFLLTRFVMGAASTVIWTGKSDLTSYHLLCSSIYIRTQC
jgi:hypothetical protein